MKFKYQAKTKGGELQVGYVEAPNRDTAATVLTGHNLFVLSLEGSDRVHWWERIQSFFSRVRGKDLMVFTRQLSTLLEAHLPLNPALRTLQEQTTHPVLKDAVRQISEDISSGLSFSQALEHQKDIFSPFYINMVHSSEIIGNMETAIGFLADYLEKEYDLASRARAALVYPAVVVSLFIVVAILMLTVVFPQIGPVFTQAGVQLPFYTQFLLNAGQFWTRWWLPIAASLLVVAGFTVNYFKTEEGEALWDELKVRIPIIRRVYVPLTVTRISNVMAMLLKGAVPITQAVEVAALTINNVLYREFMQAIAQDVRQGKTLSAAIARYPQFFPPLASQMLVVGEATGQIDKMFSRLADYYGREVDALIGNLVNLIQPALMVLIGAMVGLLFASILVPLYELTSSIQ